MTPKIIYSVMKYLNTFFSLIIISQIESLYSQKTNLFSLIPPEISGLYFVNTVQETYEKNYYKFTYIYNGGGVAVGDINNDGLSDIYFTGNEVPNKLFLNKGNFEFEDITDKADVAGDSGWYTGVSMVDVNGDGLLDIYACKSDWKNNTPSQRRNQLFINKGDLTFEEKASEYGLNDEGFSIQASFFDYDNDGDLDIYLTNHPYESNLGLEDRLDRRNNPEYSVRDRLYHNNNGKFEDVSLKAGIKNYGHGLGVVTADLNQDGYIDIYVANDFKESDYFYLNNGNGTFSNAVKEYFGHIPFYSMGVDAADINNDGLEDLFITEMLPKDYKRSKTNMAPMNVQLFEGMLELGLHHQYMHNMLQINRGINRFSEVSQMAGLSETDWSWACLLSDFDNDGLRDVFVANGFKRDFHDKDYVDKAKTLAQQQGDDIDIFQLYKLIPFTKLTNFMFKNEGDLKFTDKSNAWGFDDYTLSQGAAVSDFDNDGDLDLVINNLDEPSQIYRNNAEKLNNHFLKISLKGNPQNSTGLGAKIHIKYAEQQQIFEMKVTRGFQSSSEHIAHFGLGKHTQVDEIEVIWLNGKRTIRTNVATNQLIQINYDDAIPITMNNEEKNEFQLFEDITVNAFQPVFKHSENKFDDYKIQVLLPHKLSQLGPFISVADVNGDGLDDFYIGGAHQQSGALYIQSSNTNFIKKEVSIFKQDRIYEDMGSCFFDADGDGDNDLYVVSGSTESEAKTNYYQDRLYLNDGKGDFFESKGLPEILSSGSCVVPADFDRDGDMDLFVGGRVFPNHFPYPTPSFLLQNDKGQFRDIALNTSLEMTMQGMVTSAVWEDIDGDGDEDLITVGEWMPIKIFENREGIFSDITSVYGLENTVGWWNKIIKSDYDGDGDIDFIVGNLGLNHKFHASSEKPLHLYCSDFDQNGSFDIVLAKYYGEDQVPVRGRECSSEQMPFITEKFPTYKSFADANIDDILGENKQQSLHYEAKMFESIILERNVGGFSIKKLPTLAQIGPINGIVCADFNNDQIKDLLIAGNMYQTEVETTRNDASIGLILTGNDNSLDPMTTKQSGFFVPQDVKDIKRINIGKDNKIGILVGINDDSLRLFVRK